MELCESNITYTFGSNGIRDESNEGEETISNGESTDNLVPSADGSDVKPCAAAFGQGERSQHVGAMLPNGIDKTVQKLSGQLVGARDSDGSYLAKQTLCHSVNASAGELRLSDAMNQYLEDGFCLTTNAGRESQSVQESDDRIVNVRVPDETTHLNDAKACFVALDVPSCSRCRSCVSHKNNVRKMHESKVCEWTQPSICEKVAEFEHACFDSCSNDDSSLHEEAPALLSLQEQPAARKDVLSPDMDFLDFDFDPPPSGDEMQCGESDESSDEGRARSPPLICDTYLGANGNDLGGPSDHLQQCLGHSLSFQNLVSSPKYQNCLKPFARSNSELHNLEDGCSDNTDSDSANMEACGERLLQRESSLFNISNEEMECEDMNLQSALLNSLSTKTIGDKQTSFSSDNAVGESTDNSGNVDETEKIMIWSELEACNRQVTQIGTSACGATAVINVLMALGVSFDKEAVEKHIHTRLRAETAPISTYLISRSVAGTTHEDLIEGIHLLTGGSVYGHFFHFYPNCNANLIKWLGCWIKKGAVPLATLNLQCSVIPGQSIPDAWHHQMIFGVGPKGVYMTNPLECVPLAQIQQQLCSESILLVRRNDVLSRWGDNCDLSPLLTHPDSRWRTMNVIGQVINILRESTAPWIPGYRRHLTTHVKIPAAYKSGITLFVHKNSEVYNELNKSKEI